MAEEMEGLVVGGGEGEEGTYGGWVEGGEGGEHCWVLLRGEMVRVLVVRLVVICMCDLYGLR